eukprot:scaffold78_cov609-Prasinococcus_capsulatus_cf.AAC.6
MVDRVLAHTAAQAALPSFPVLKDALNSFQIHLSNASLDMLLRVPGPAVAATLAYTACSSLLLTA